MMNNCTAHIWAKGPTKLTLRNHEVHLWCSLLPISKEVIAILENNLSIDELQRLSKLHLPADKMRFIVGRGGLKQLLARYLNVDPTKMCFNYTSCDKPYLKGTPLHFNLSHSGNYILYAIANSAIGIDIEYCDSTLDFLTLAKEFCSELEWHTLSMLAPAERSTTFYRYWTQKEAFVKAIGTGLNFPLKQVNKASALLQGWRMKNIMLHKEYAASVALPVGTKQVAYWQCCFEDTLTLQTA